MYSARVLDHFHNPRNVGEIAEATVVVEMTNLVCGDLLKLWAVIEDGNLVEVKFKTQGCVPAVASGSWLTGEILGRSLNELHGVTPEDIEAGLDSLPSASRDAAVLAADALRRPLQQFT